jgi:hypothetical protein
MPNLGSAPESFLAPWVLTALVPGIEPGILTGEQPVTALASASDPRSDPFQLPLSFEPLQSEDSTASELSASMADPLTGQGSGAITPYASITGGGPQEFGSTIVAAGEQDDYTFTGTAGQQLAFDGLIAASGIGAQLTSPTGVSLFNSGTATTDQLLRLSEAGTHRLVIYGSAAATGHFRSRILDTKKAAALKLGDSVSCRLDPGTGDHLYRFTGTSGQQLFFDQLSGGGSNYANHWSIYGPDGQLVASNNLTSDTEVFALPADGSYLMVVYGNDNTPVDFQFRLLAAQTTLEPLLLSSTPVSGALANPGNQENYTFTGTAGVRERVAGAPQEIHSGNLAILEKGEITEGLTIEGGALLNTGTIHSLNFAGSSESSQWLMQQEPTDDLTSNDQVALLVNAGPTPAEAIGDFTPPALTYVELLSGGTVDATFGEGHIALRIGAGDDLSGVAQLGAVYMNESGGYISLGNSVLLDGNPLSGSYLTSNYTNLNQWTAPGNYSLNFIYIDDNSGNYAHYNPKALASLGIDTTLLGIKIENFNPISDRQAPVLTSVSLAQSSGTVNIADSGGGLFRLLINGQDNASGIRSISARFKSPSGNNIISAYTTSDQRDVIAGTNRNGTFLVSGIFSGNDEVGTWTLDDIYVSDNAQNYHYYSSQDLERLGLIRQPVLIEAVKHDSNTH